MHRLTLSIQFILIISAIFHVDLLQEESAG